MTGQALTQTSLQGLPLFHSGKVRDSYDLGDRLLIVATDRISAFDVIMPEGIPGKGRALTELSVYWFERTGHIVPNHLLTTDVSTLDELTPEEQPLLDGRSMIVRKAERIDFECVVRGYIAGSAWKEFRESGTIAGLPASAAYRESDKLTEPIFTPARKNDQGHDENISVQVLRSEIGAELAAELERLSLALYQFASDHALNRGIIIADTKFEFGMVDGQLIVIDEMLTPDSSRFWDLDKYEPGRSQDSYDKQFLRDWLLSTGWDREPPAPALPQDIIDGTRRRYEEAVERLTGPAIATHNDQFASQQTNRERTGVA